MSTKEKSTAFKIFLRFLSLAYFTGFLFHAADILNLRLAFQQMDRIWQIWIIYLLIMDLSASIGLWFLKSWGIYLFLIIAISQLVAYIGFIDKFGRQDFLIAFHIVTIAVYFLVSKTKLSARA